MSNSLTEMKRKQAKLSIFNSNHHSDKRIFLEIGNQKAIDKLKEIDYMTEIYYQSLH